MAMIRGTPELSRGASALRREARAKIDFRGNSIRLFYRATRPVAVATASNLWNHADHRSQAEIVVFGPPVEDLRLRSALI
jgi:hypothetical protein